MGVRKTYRNLTDVERDRFVQALFQLKANGIVDRFAQMHAEHFFMGIHRSSHFLPWHREMLLRFERRLQHVHPDITIPYWASAVRRSTSDPLWANNFLGQFNSAWNLSRALGSDILPTQQQVTTNRGRGGSDGVGRSRVPTRGGAKAPASSLARAPGLFRAVPRSYGPCIPRTSPSIVI